VGGEVELGGGVERDSVGLGGGERGGGGGQGEEVSASDHRVSVSRLHSGSQSSQRLEKPLLANARHANDASQGASGEWSGAVDRNGNGVQLWEGQVVSQTLGDWIRQAEAQHHHS
jgi:hypothetical protein